jgi:hypothetical protein
MAGSGVFNLKRWRRLVPRPVKRGIKHALFQRRYGFAPPPDWSDISGYEVLLDTLASERTLCLEGDLLEIGAFLGGGTFKLCRFVGKHAPAKRVYAVDVFEADFDSTVSTEGVCMATLYGRVLRGRDQYEVYSEVTSGCENLTTLKADSMHLALPCEKICFAYVDGNHDPAYVRNDFELAWRKLVAGGIIAFDDYGFDLPGVTAAVDACIERTRDEIRRTWTRPPKTMFIQKTRTQQDGGTR